MHEQGAVLKQISYHLEQAGIPYMLSGSTAMNYYAQPRMTRDIDLVVEIQAADTARLVAQLGEDCDRLPPQHRGQVVAKQRQRDQHELLAHPDRQRVPELGGHCDHHHGHQPEPQRGDQRAAPFGGNQGITSSCLHDAILHQPGMTRR